MDMHNYIKFLVEKEVVVELTIRNIDLNNENWKEELESAIINESKDPKLIPSDSHITLSPETEVEAGRDIVESFDTILKTDQSNESLLEVYYRSIHWNMRLQRLKKKFSNVPKLIVVLEKFKRVIQSIQSRLEVTRVAKSKELLSQKDSSSITKTEDTNQESTECQTSWPVNNFSDLISKKPEKLVERGTINKETHSGVNSNEFYIDLGQRMEREHARFYMPKWKLLFVGDARGINVFDFLFRLETFARRDGFPYNRLPSIIHAFVSETAEKWLWVYTRDHPDSSWDELRSAFLARFSGPETEREKRRIIERKVQKYREPINDFILELQTLNGRLSNRFSESELMEIIRENMSPALQTSTLQMQFRDIEDLRTICHKYERIWSKSGYEHKYQGDLGKNRHISEIIPSTSHDQAANVIPENGDRGDSKELSAIAGQFKNGNSATPIICWNCRDIGHRYHDCKKDFSDIFCFGCGKGGVRKPNCTNCNRSLQLNNSPNVVRPVGIRSVITQNTPRNPSI